MSTQSQLDDLLGGLLLNVSGNLTGSLLNESAELPTLGFSQNLLTALANRVLPNIGAWGAPTSTYTPPPPPKPWYEVAASLIVNAVSGVIHLVTGILSVAWNAAVAAAAYLAKAAEAEATALGITALADQLGNVLKAVASAMEQALAALEQYLMVQATAFLKSALEPVKTSFSHLSEPYAGPVAEDFANDPGLAQSLYSGPFWDILTLGLAVGTSILVVMTVLDGLTFGSLVLVSFAIPLIIAAVFAVFPSLTSAFLNLPLISSLASALLMAPSLASSLINGTSAALSKPLTPTDQAAFDSGVGEMRGIALISAALLSVLVAVISGGPVVFKAVIALGIVLVSIALVVFVTTNSDPNYQIHHTVGDKVALASMAVGIIGLLVLAPGLLRGGVPPGPLGILVLATAALSGVALGANLFLVFFG